ncbi:nucleotide-binding domain-containing protein [Hypoxylon trugodes]|uniref:nucleotide-binding domain-containing protein n=1 Tax=Hypoxylon trugodes TaxID=326681 RepID=UPI00218E0EB2|nr:nucleotide-binding domain-containing protein [Hypoxylon trugodes]KAI1382882.1 nucleotide-binding domain-containing protein [Hypoxylon trugodes]
MSYSKSVIIVGAGVFGLSLALALRARNYDVVVFDQHPYDRSAYQPGYDDVVQAASVDHNKIFRASYGTKAHYQRLALESRREWISLNAASRDLQKDGADLFVNCGMLRVQPTDELGALELETLKNLERDGLRDTQFIKSDLEDRQRARKLGWQSKLLEFDIPDVYPAKTFEAVLDSLAGYTKSSEACAHYQKVASIRGVKFQFGLEGTFDSLVKEPIPGSGRIRAVGIRTKDGVFHKADVVVIAAGSFSTQLFPELSYHLESSAGSVVTFKIDKHNTVLWNKYSPERFPVMTWKSATRGKDGKDIGSVYVFPRTEDGVMKIGYRGIKFTNFQPAPKGTPFTQHDQWSVPLPPLESLSIPQPAIDAIRAFVSIFLPEFRDVAFHSTKLCWYTDSLDNSFVVDYVPTYAENSVFVCAGGSGHGAKFLPVLGEHAADILEKGEESSSYMRKFWRWRDNIPRGNGLQEGPDGPRNIGRERIHTSDT